MFEELKPGVEDPFQTRGDRKSGLDNSGESFMRDLTHEESSWKPGALPKRNSKAKKHQGQSKGGRKPWKGNRSTERKGHQDDENIEATSMEDGENLREGHRLSCCMFEDSAQVV